MAEGGAATVAVPPPNVPGTTIRIARARAVAGGAVGSVAAPAPAPSAATATRPSAKKTLRDNASHYAEAGKTALTASTWRGGSRCARLGPVDALAQLTAEPERSAIFLDVDGTLAPIVDDPDDSRVPDATRAELERLASRYALVACVSGRSSSRAREIVGVPALTYVGEHGLELDPEAEEWAPRIHAFAAEAGWPAEDKPLSAAFHYRTAPDQDEARRVLEGIERSARAEGFRTRWGRLVLEVLPPLEASKRTAVRRLLATHGIARALYAGDDATDLDGFAALDGLETAVRVAVISHEGPSELVNRADLIVGSPGELAGLLAKL